ncbi:MAG: hypothetical protein JNK37_25175 [Verrucomicrobiales bacterium]|nr:hypothetical protein [Verrucomicrobiales bacterium]
MKTANEISLRLDQFKSRYWTKEQFNEWYNLDLDDKPTLKLWVQAGLFAGTEGAESTLGPDPFDHWHFEVFLQRRELVPIAAAAASLAMDVPTFREVCEKFASSPGAAIVGSPGESNSIVRKGFLRDFHKGFDSLRRRAFASHSNYIALLHEAIKMQLDLVVNRTIDLTDVALGESPPRAGYYIDCLTGEPFGLGNDVFLETQKPIQLLPDSCSLRTYACFENILRDHVLGAAPDLDSETKQKLIDSAQ